jgi:hypothetical protein
MGGGGMGGGGGGMGGGMCDTILISKTGGKKFLKALFILSLLVSHFLLDRLAGQLFLRKPFYSIGMLFVWPYSMNITV